MWSLVGGRGVVLALAVVVAAVRVEAQTDTAAKLPGAAKEPDTSALIGTGRLKALPDVQRREWEAYLQRSRVAQQADQALLNRELGALGKTAMTRAAFLSQSFDYSVEVNDAVMASDSVQAMVLSMLSYQTPSGGWSKHVDFWQGVRQRGQSFFSENEKWQYIATIDNDATTSELRYLMHHERVRPDANVRASVARGVGYLLAAQFPTGCWPQVWPLQGSYHDAATFNDDATVEVLQLLDGVAQGKVPYIADSLRTQALAAVTLGIDCILRAQVKVGGQLTVWGQQHDPITLAATSARSYEPTSLTSKESAGVFEFLMAHAAMDVRIPAALAGAAAWFEQTALHGMRSEGRNGLVPNASAGPVWARMYEIGTNRPIFSNRDGIKLYDFDKLTDRREGYGWYSEQPASSLKKYRKWLAARVPATARARGDRYGERCIVVGGVRQCGGCEYVERCVNGDACFENRAADRVGSCSVNSGAHQATGVSGAHVRYHEVRCRG